MALWEDERTGVIPQPTLTALVDRTKPHVAITLPRQEAVPVPLPPPSVPPVVVQSILAELAEERPYTSRLATILVACVITLGGGLVLAMLFA